MTQDVKEKAAAMHKATDIGTLIERVEAATGGDRALDGEIDAALFGGKASHTFSRDTPSARLRSSYGTGTVFFSGDAEENGGHVLTSHYRKAHIHTGSIDAAVSLIERVRPGWSWRITLDPLEDGKRPFWAGVAERPATHGAWGETPALALVLALLRSLQENQT